MAFTSGIVVIEKGQYRQERSHSMENFAGADLHKRVTQLAILRDGQPPSQFRFPNDPKTVHGVLRKLPPRHKDSSRGHRFMVVVCREGTRIGTRSRLSHPKQTTAIADARLPTLPRCASYRESLCGNQHPMF